MAVVPWQALQGAGQLAGALGTCLYEDGARLLHGHVAPDAVGTLGGGRYSHSDRTIWFAASDNTDPNTNGRTYEVDCSLDPVSWKQALLHSLTELWDLHPEGAFFKSRGGREIPPPLFINLGLTNKCNLRCEICGSQKFLDATGVHRRHMELRRLDAVAATLFPTAAEVELNSQGDPLLYPEVDHVLELVAQYRCELKVQTNGTLFTERIVERLCEQSATIMLSLDAVGPRFDEVRRGGVWARAEPGLKRLLRQRAPDRQSIGIYPTVTRRTLADALDVAKWAHDHDVDEVAFHRYNPILNSTEEAPTADELKALADRLAAWASGQRSAVTIRLDGQVLSPGRLPRRNVHADPLKHCFATLVEAMMVPMEAGERFADPAATCVAPDHYVEVGLEGQIAACCRAQDVNLGYATSPEAFARAWFGDNYRNIRASLRREASGPFPLPNCESCIASFAPGALRRRRAADYNEGTKDNGRLDYADWEELPLEVIQQERGHCHIALVPPGFDLAEYRLYEDDLPLDGGGAMHDEIRELGGGRHSLWGRAVYFSTTDNSDARRNGRAYTLRRIAPLAD